MERDRMRRETLDDDTLSLFCSQLSLMLQAGIGVEEGAALLAGDADEPGQRTLLAGLRAGLDRGEPLSQALEATGGFPDYLLRMVEIGQASGRLDQVLAALGRYYARQADTRRALRRAVAYPAVMAVLIAVIFLVLVARVLPVFQQVFVQLGVELSPVAAALLRFGSAGQAVTAAAAVVLALCALLLVWLLRAQTGAAALSGLFARTRAARALGRSWFASAMAMMLSSGVPLDEAMERTAGLLAGSPLAAPWPTAGRGWSRGSPSARRWSRRASSPDFRRDCCPPASGPGAPTRPWRSFPNAAGRRPTRRWNSCSAGSNTLWWRPCAQRWPWCFCR